MELQPNPPGVPELGRGRGGTERQPERGLAANGHLVAREPEQNGGESSTPRALGGGPGEASHSAAPGDGRESRNKKRAKLGRMGASGCSQPVAVAKTAPERGADDQGGDPGRDQEPGGAHEQVEGARRHTGGGTSASEEAASTRDGKRGTQGFEELLRPRWLDNDKKHQLRQKARQLDKAFQEAIRVYHAVCREACNRAHQCEEVVWGTRPALFEIGGPNLMVTEAFKEASLPYVEPLVCPEGLEDKYLNTAAPDKDAVVNQVVLEEPGLAWMCPAPLLWNEDNSSNKEEKRRCRAMARLVAEIFEIQSASGRQAVVTHPVGSGLWEQAALSKLCSQWDTYVFYYDLEAFGDDVRAENIRMRAVTTHRSIAEALAFQSDRSQHVGGWNASRGFRDGQVPKHFGRMVVEVAVVTKEKEPSAAYCSDSTAPFEAYTGEAGGEGARDSHLEEHGAGVISFDPRVPKPIQAALKRVHQNLGHLPNSW